jgi:hypothetical protein
MVKRVFQTVVLFFAIYAFVFVPLGRKTALEHVRAIAGTRAAHQAASELEGGAKRLVQELREQAQRSTEATDEEIAGSEAADAPPPVPSQSERAKPSKSRPAEAATTPPAKPHKGPQHLPPAAASNTPDPSPFDLSSVQHPPDLKELRSLSAGHSGR